jgi:hypothetical protein
MTEPTFVEVRVWGTATRGGVTLARGEQAVHAFITVRWELV